MSSLEGAATWLKSHVGVGGVFTKEELRSAFPSITQIDRRVRDLRKYGWIIETRREDPSLGSAEMRLVKVGELTRSDIGISPRDRRKAMLSTAYTCALCGGAGGSPYPDAQHTRVTLQVLDLGGKLGLIVCCARCRPDAASLPEIADDPLPATARIADAAALSNADWVSACRARIARRLASS